MDNLEESTKQFRAELEASRKEHEKIILGNPCLCRETTVAHAKEHWNSMCPYYLSPYFDRRATEE